MVAAQRRDLPWWLRRALRPDHRAVLIVTQL
jgi:hypothetical protein